MYMAPELISGSRFARPSSDIFSLGVIAHELLTAEMPFKKPPIGSVMRQETLVLSLAIRARKDLPAPLVELVERCLSVDPAQRPTAQELATALAACGSKGA